MNEAATRVGRLPALSTGTKVGIVAAIAIAGTIPLVYSDQYVLNVLVTALITLLLTTAWNFVLGIAGVWNFGMIPPLRGVASSSC